MSFKRYILPITYIMTCLGLASASLVESLNPVFLAAVAVLVAASFALNMRERRLIAPRLWTILALFLFSFFILDYLSISGDLITAASRFLAVMVAFKLFDLGRVRDHFIVYVLAFFQVLAAAASTVSPLFLLILSLFIISGIWAMIVFNIQRDWSEARYGKPMIDVPRGVLSVRFFVSTVPLSIIALVMTFALFFVMPRMGIGFFEAKTLDTVKVSGFSDTVDLGAIGPVKTDPTVVMRVELPRYAGSSERPGELLYFRGTTLDTYDGETWTREAGEKELLRRGVSGMFRVRGVNGPVLEQKILLEPLETEVLFAASHVVRLSEGSEEKERLTNLWTDSAGSVYLPSPAWSRLEYTAWSARGPLPPGPDATDPAYTDDSYLDTIAEGGRVRELVSRVTSGAGSDTARALALEKYLRENYRYTLSPEAGGGEDTLTDFLFHSREGYCEHYATALSMLLRAAGIPSRMVTGFVPGEWNAYGGYYIVRQQDSHTWVEAYVEGTGWISLDPTPAAGLDAFYKPSELALFLDTLRWKWNRYIIQFTLTDQRRIASGIEGETSRLVSSLRGLLLGGGGAGGAGGGDGVAGYLGALVAAALAIYLFLRLYGGRGSGGSKVPGFYAELLKALERKGLRKEPGETPMEFARRTGLDDAREVTELYHRERYGGEVPTREEMERVREAIGRIKSGAGTGLRAGA